MSKIKKLSVKVTYDVTIGNIELPDEVIDQMVDAADNFADIQVDDMEYGDAQEWIVEHINESDCVNWECQIEDIELAEG